MEVGLAFDAPEERSGAMFVLAHGAGGSMSDPLLVDLSRALRALGHGVARFNFAYRDAGRRLPDRAPILEATYREMLAKLRRELRGRRRWIVGGKSMGGRMATHLAAAGDAMDGLLLLGYPLHPPNRKDKLRIAHLASIRVPALFVQGTRDPLCDLKLLRKSLKPMGELATLEVVQRGDHSLSVPKRGAPDRGAHIAAIAARIDDWLKAL